jgi:hypothetical protein
VANTDIKCIFSPVSFLGDQPSVNPPFTTIDYPVIKLAAGDARNTIAPIMSSGVSPRGMHCGSRDAPESRH